MHISIVPVLIAGTFVYMYELQLVLKHSYYRVTPLMMSWGYPYDVIGWNTLSNNNKPWYQYQYWFIYLFCHYSEIFVSISNTCIDFPIDWTTKF